MNKHDDSVKKAVALKYTKGIDQAPTVKAKGRNLVAEEIIAEAKKANIPIQEDPTLVTLLSQLELNEQIPEELYELVAEIFAFIYQLDTYSGESQPKDEEGSKRSLL
ncbi:putative flagellar biosynthetic protein flhB [Bacillus sp. TS-2]|nr:putative flagellar biosynthetic protein flhB [Bacillus sp. TS-2]